LIIDSKPSEEEIIVPAAAFTAAEKPNIKKTLGELE